MLRSGGQKRRPLLKVRGLEASSSSPSAETSADLPLVLNFLPLVLVPLPVWSLPRRAGLKVVDVVVDAVAAD